MRGSTMTTPSFVFLLEGLLPWPWDQAAASTFRRHWRTPRWIRGASTLRNLDINGNSVLNKYMMSSLFLMISMVHNTEDGMPTFTKSEADR